MAIPPVWESADTGNLSAHIIITRKDNHFLSDST